MKAKNKRIPDIAISVVGEGIAEWYYIDYIKELKGYRFRISPKMPVNSNFRGVFKRAKNLLKERDADIVFCVIDLDKIRQDNCIHEFRKAVREIKDKNIIPIASYPSIEAWFLFHFMENPSSRFYENEEEAEKALKRHIPAYAKSEEYLRKSDLYRKLEEGNLSKAIKHSKALTSNVQGFDGIINATFSEIGYMLEFIDDCWKCIGKDHCTECIHDLRSKLPSSGI